MDSFENNKPIAEENNVFLSFDSTDFSKNLVHVHTEPKESTFKTNLDKDIFLTNEKEFDGARLLSTSEYNKLKDSTNSFHKWYSQTKLLAHLLEEALPVSTNSSNYLKKDSFFLEKDAGKKDKFYDKYYDEYGLFFDKYDDGTLVNKSVVTFLMTNFSSPDDYKHVSLEKSMTSEFNEFKLKFLELLNDESNELKLKRALLTVAFNHYGCSVVKNLMTLDEYNSMLKVHKVFQSETMAKFVFDTMDRNHISKLTLNEFVSGMLSCSPEENHNLNTSFGLLRLQHVFRAYDLDHLGYLNQNSLNFMLNHLSQLSDDADYFSDLEELSENLLSLFDGKLGYDLFFYLVEHDSLKATRLLFRSDRDIAKSMKDFLVNSLNHVLPADKPKPKVSSLLNQPSVDDDLFEQSPKENPPLNRDFTFGNQSEMTKTYENTNNKTLEPPVGRHSIWSHTPRVYSEFTNNRPFSTDSMYNFGYGNSWSKSNYSSQNQKQNSIDRVSKLYEENLITPKKYQTEHNQDNNNKLKHHFSYLKDPSPSNSQFTDSDMVFDGLNRPKSVERTPDVARQDSEDVFVDALDSKQVPSVTGNKKLDELLKEYNLQQQTPQSSATTEHKSFATVKDADLFEDVFEDESQLLSQYKEQTEVFTPCENSNDLYQKEEKCDLEQPNAFQDVKQDLDQNLNKENYLTPEQNLNQDLKNDKPNEPANEMKFLDDPIGDDEELKDNLDQRAVGEPKFDSTEDQNNAEVPDTGVSDQVSKQQLNYSTLEAFTEQLSKFYKSKFLIFKGLLVDDTVARSVFTKFLSHSLGDSTDHSSLDLCTFSDMLQLCDSVCSLLRKEDSLLELKGDFQVFASMNGDLSCLLDFFNTFGWPMVKKKVLDDFNLNQNSNLNTNLSLLLKSNNWMNFDNYYLFMGGFVSDVSSVSLEFVMFLFSLKVLFPYHVYFLRSNKDERSFTNDVGFYDEVYRKLSQNHSSFKVFNDETFVLQCSKELFHRVNDVFEFMSVAAVLNNNVLCVDKLNENFTYSKLANLPKPLSLSTCDQEFVYDLLFNRSNSTQSVDHLHNNNNSNRDNKEKDKDEDKKDNKEAQKNKEEKEDNTDNNKKNKENKDNNVKSSLKPNTLLNSQDFNKFKLVLCSSDDLDSGYKQLMNNKLLYLSTNFNKKKNHKVATSVVFNGSKLTYRSLKL